jgi:hypothetical protein
MDRKVKLATLVDAQTAQILRQRATLHQLSLSQTAAELLAGAVKSTATDGSTVLFFAELRQTLHRDVARMADRLAYLLVRGAVEAGATRREVFNLLLRSGLPLEAAKQIHDSAWHATVAALRKPLAEVHDLARPNGEPVEETVDAPPR